MSYSPKYFIKYSHRNRNNRQIFTLIKRTIIKGERLSAYESVPDEIKDEQVFDGVLSDCYAYIRIKQLEQHTEAIVELNNE